MLTADDHALRRGRMTGSAAAAALGLDPYCTPLGAYLRIIGEAPANDDGQRARFRRGHVLEPALMQFAAEEIAADTGATVAIDTPPTIVHPSIPWAACSIDALFVARPGPRAVVELDALTVPEAHAVSTYGGEAKTVDQQHAWAWGEPWTDQIPAHVAVQCTWEILHYPDVEAIVLPVLIGAGLDLRCYVWTRQPELEAACVEVLGEWHARHVVRREPPPLVAKDASVLSTVWRASGRVLPDDPRVRDLVRADDDARRREIAAGRERDAVRVALASILQDANECRGPWGSVTWRAGKSGGRTLRTHWRGGR
jgi:hypothetical protein